MTNPAKYINKKGFTITEVLTASAIFLIFFLSILEILILGMGYLKKVDADITAQQNCSIALEVISSDSRQGSPDADPGTNGNTPTGYLSITPEVAPTAILYPNANNQTSNYLLFTKPNFSSFDPTAVGFLWTNPNNFVRVKYYVQDQKMLVRETQTILPTGQLQAASSETLVETVDGTLSLSFKYLSPKTCEISVTSVENLNQRSQVTRTAKDILYVMVEQ